MLVIIVMGAQYAFLYGVDFLFSGDGYLARLTGVSYQALDIGLLAWIVIYLGICSITFFVGRLLYRVIARNIAVKASTIGLVKILLTCVAFILVILYRGYILISSGAVVLSESECFDAAVGLFNEESGIGDLGVHGATYAYIMILSFIMRFLGDRVVSVLMLQIVIQIITIMLAFFVFNRLVNYTSGLVTVLFLGFSPLYTTKIFTSSPGCFVALLVVFSLFLISCFLKMNGGVFKGIIGAIIGLMIGYMIYMDLTVVLALVLWFFALMYEIGDPDKHNYLIPYIIMFLCIVIGFALSIGLDGGFNIDGIDIAAQTWLKVTLTTQAPEYSLVDASLGLSCLIQCMILVGVAAMTILGTIGRNRVEYEFPWILMLLCAITPMTCIGFLHDNTFPLIAYTALAGAGISAMFHLPAETDDEEEEDEDEEDEDNDNADDVRKRAHEQSTVEALLLTPSNDVEGRSDNNDDGIEYMTLSDVKPKADDNTDETSSGMDMTDETVSGQDQAGDGIEYEELEEIKPQLTSDNTELQAKTEEEEVLPESISWASIKALDDDAEDIFDDEEDELVLSSKDKDFDVVVEGGGFVTEEVYEPETDDDNDEKSEELKQVDELPGMIPNPLPLPPKKEQKTIDFDRDLDEDSYEDEDMEWDVNDSDDDDFDI